MLEKSSFFMIKKTLNPLFSGIHHHDIDINIYGYIRAFERLKN